MKIKIPHSTLKEIYDTSFTKDKLFEIIEKTGFNIDHKPTKTKSLDLFISCILDSSNLKDIYNNLNITEKKIFAYFIYNNSTAIINVQYLYPKIEILSYIQKGHYNDVVSLKYPFNLFVDKSFKFLPQFSKFFKTFIPKPQFENVEYLENSNGFNLNDPKIDDFFKIYYNLLQNKKIKLTKDNLISKRSLNDINNLIDCTDDDEKILRKLLLNANLITDKEQTLIATFEFETLINSKYSSMLIKEVLRKYLANREFDEIDLMPFNKYHYYEIPSFTTFRKKIFEKLKKLEGKWLNINEFAKELIKDNLIQIQHLPYSEDYRRKGINYNLKDYDRNYSANINQPTEINIILIYNSVIKTILRHFQLLNIIKVSISPTPLYPSKFKRYVDYEKNIEFFAPYDNITHLKVTSFGEFVMGKRDDYEEDNEKYNINLEDNLEITVTNPNEITNIFLSSFSEKLNKNCYIASFETILKNIKEPKEFNELKNKIIKSVKSVPQNWKNLFEKIENRTTAFSKINNEVVLFKIKKDKEILKIIATNEKLKSLILKADGFHILIYKKNLIKAKNILKKDGFFI